MDTAMTGQDDRQPAPRGAGGALPLPQPLRAALSDAIAGVVDRDVFLQRTAELVAEAVGWPLVALYTRAAAGEALLLRASTLPGATGAPGRITLAHDAVVEIEAAAGHSALVAPLTQHAEPFGAVVVFSENGGRFNAADRARLAGVAAEIAPIVALAEEHHAVKEASVVDLTTGAHASWYLARRLEQEIARAQRGGGQGRVTVLLVGILGFDELQDRHEYAALEGLLRDLADGLRAVTRIFDIVGYQGGGVFAVVLPESGVEGAGIVIDRIRAQVSRQLQRFVVEAAGGRPGTSPASIVSGVAAYPEDGDRVAALLLAAEHRLDADRRQQRRADAS